MCYQHEETKGLITLLKVELSTFNYACISNQGRAALIRKFKRMTGREKTTWYCDITLKRLVLPFLYSAAILV